MYNILAGILSLEDMANMEWEMASIGRLNIKDCLKVSRGHRKGSSDTCQGCPGGSAVCMPTLQLAITTTLKMIHRSGIPAVCMPVFQRAAWLTRTKSRCSWKQHHRAVFTATASPGMRYTARWPCSQC